MSRVSIIAALGTGRVIGKDNDLLWRFPGDLKHFKKLTDGHPVIMGRKTWESLPQKFRPLPNRANIVVTRDTSYAAAGAAVAHSLEEALKIAEASEGNDEVFVIGGGQLYAAALPSAARLYLTLVDDATPGTVYFPEYTDFSKEIESEEHEEHGIRYRWVTLER